MSVAPVVSSPEAFNVTVIADKDQDNSHHKVKRREITTTVIQTSKQ